jgi:hypothetical protein
MIELREDQLSALDAGPLPARAVDPRTGQEYVLIKSEIFEIVRRRMKPFTIDPKDTTDDDLIRKDR